ncbi:MAG: hypothetical protein JNL82_19840 [Myxococcales bacterium]|nr:hypothetical protein [Myxococcales bacterium]
MGFGRNPYVPKAQAAELKAQEASDELARARHYHEAAHEWDRAASREKPGKARSEYEAHALRTRELADSPAEEPSEADEHAEPPTQAEARPLRLIVRDEA